MNLDAILIEGGLGAITASGSSLTESPVLLPMVFHSQNLAQEFLSACERSAVSLFPDMGYRAMKQLYDLWYDAWKRPNGIRVVTGGGAGGSASAVGNSVAIGGAGGAAR